MKMLRIAISLLAGILLLCTAAHADYPWVEEKITSGGGWFRGGPQVWEDTVHWNDRRSGSGSDIYVWDRAGGERPLIATSASESVWAVHEDRLAITEYTDSQYDLYLWDPTNGKRMISIAPGDQRGADIYQDTVVWEDWRAGYPQVYIWDPINGERPISPTNYWQTSPKIWGNRVVWEDSRWGGSISDVYMWTPEEGERLLGMRMCRPAIHGDRVVMWHLIEDPRHPYDPTGLWEWTPQGGLRLLLSMPSLIKAFDTDIWGDLVVWTGNGILSWDPTNGVRKISQTPLENSASAPSIYGTTVVWANDYDIYMATLVPEPSTPATFLLGSLGLGGVTLSRRRRIAGGLETRPNTRLVRNGEMR